MGATATEVRAALGGARDSAEPVVREPVQFSVWEILAVWAAATLPMGAAAWIVSPFVAGSSGAADALPKALLVTLSLGLAWQFLLVVGLVYREQATLRWSTVSQVLWLRAPRSPHTGRQGGRLWLVVLPMIVGLTLVEAVPAIPHPVNRDLGPFLSTPAGHAAPR